MDFDCAQAPLSDAAPAIPTDGAMRIAIVVTTHDASGLCLTAKRVRSIPLLGGDPRKVDVDEIADSLQSIVGLAEFMAETGSRLETRSRDAWPDRSPSWPRLASIVGLTLIVLGLIALAWATVPWAIAGLLFCGCFSNVVADIGRAPHYGVVR